MNGAWETCFAHDTTGFTKQPPVYGPNAKFHAIHMALIPVDTSSTGIQLRGRVIVFDSDGSNAPNPPAKQRWSIVDPNDPQMQVLLNFELVMPQGKGDLFCAGHAWTQDGQLFVAGGTTQYEKGTAPWLGGKLVYLWDPLEWNKLTTKRGWHKQADLVKARWYPTVTRDGENALIISGGSETRAGNPPPVHNNYEAYRVTNALQHTTAFDKDSNNNRVYAGPGTGGSPFSLYPRFHLLSTGEVITSGHGPDSARVKHVATQNPPLWKYDAGDQPQGSYRHDGTSVLFPIDLNIVPAFYDHVLRMGGANGSQVLDSAEYAIGSLPGPWVGLPAMAFMRVELNSVLLPDMNVLVIGSQTNAPGTTPLLPVYTPELYKGGQWIQMANMTSPADYHSTAVLLPDARVFRGGGEGRTWDYEIYSPPYLYCGERPVITSAPATTLYNAGYVVAHQPLQTQCPPTCIDKVVLIAPGSVTHHSCMSQRVISCTILQKTSSTVTFLTPPNANYAPAGHYMVFLVTNHGVPSVAAWTKIG